jgi:hypothetical protein
MKNLVQGWITSLIGLAIMIADGVHYFGLYRFPSPTMISTDTQSLVAFIIGLALFVMPKTKIESIVENVITKKSDQL